MRALGTPLLIHQPSYSIFNRWIEPELLGALEAEGLGCIVFSPLAQGLLTNRYLGEMPADSRAAKPTGFLKAESITEEKLVKVRALNALAQERGQTLAQLALSWCLRHPQVTSVLIGASRPAQITDCAGALGRLEFSAEELARIDEISPVS